MKLATESNSDNKVIGNAEADLKEAKETLDALDVFKKDLGTFTRY